MLVQFYCFEFFVRMKAYRLMWENIWGPVKKQNNIIIYCLSLYSWGPAITCCFVRFLYLHKVRSTSWPPRLLKRRILGESKTLSYPWRQLTQRNLYVYEWISLVNKRTIFQNRLILLAISETVLNHRIKHIFKSSSSKYNETFHYYLKENIIEFSSLKP